MTTEKMTVHKALCELKTLDARIQKSIQQGTFVFANKHSNNKVAGVSINTYSEEIRAAYQSAKDLIARRDAIKRAVTLSNATVKVTIGGKEYTGADEYVKSLYGNVDMKGASDEIKKVRADFIAAQTMEIVDPINITTELTALEKEINDFVVEIDSALSVSNALTELEIAY